MRKLPNRQPWRQFIDRVAKDEKYLSEIDTKRYGPYSTYRQIFLRIEKVLKRFPRNITPLSIGKSAEGEPIWIFRVHTDAESDSKVPRFLVSSVIHAQEFISAEINVALFERFANNMRQNKSLWGREVCFLPILNPDGFLRVEHDLAEGHRRFFRSNRNGVDLNRNFSAFFSKRYFLHRLFPRIWYPGYRPFSEPETAGYREFLLENRFDYALSLHSFGGYFFYPYGGSKNRSLDDAWFRKTCQEMIDRQPRYGYSMKQLGRFLPFFRARGTETDYLYETFGTRSVLIEIGKRKLGLLHPKVMFNPFNWSNPHDPELEVDNLIEPLFYFLSLPRIRAVE